MGIAVLQISSNAGPALGWWCLLPFAVLSFGLAWLVAANKKLQRKTALLGAQLAKANQSNQRGSEFMTNISHELLTPMNGILGMADLALGTDLDDFQRDCLTTINDSGQRLLAIVSDILDCARMQRRQVQLKTADLEIRKLITNTVRAFAIGAHDKGIELVFFISEDVPALVRGDAARLRQILVNLLGNAIKFTKRGEVELRCETELASIGDIYLHFSIRDTGVGIPEDKRKEIFEAFTQADPSVTREFGGIGLGLTISSELVKMMGGDMKLESAPGRGSTFHFTVRLVSVIGAAESTAAPEYKSPLAGKRMLIVDDNETNANHLADSLAKEQTFVERVRNAASALAKVQEAQAAGELFDLLIIDSDMPGTDAFALAEKIGHQPGSVRPALMMLTSKNLAEHAEQCKRLGIGYLLKPVSADQLREVAGDLVRKIERARMEAAQHEEPSAAPARAAPLRILLAEDNVGEQRLVLEMLKRCHCEVHVVQNGVEALASWRHREYDVILMDIQMPRMDGLEATGRIRAAEATGKRHTTVLALGDKATEEERHRCISAGMDEYLGKPLDFEQLLRKMQYFSTNAI